MLQYRAGSNPGPVLAAGIASVALAAVYLVLPASGTDLAAQVARAQFVRSHGLRPVDFGWYGGVFPYGYSLLTGPLDALLGARVVGAIAAVGGAIAFAYLLARTRVRRPLLGGVLGAASMLFNVVSGRITFAVGLTLGLVALCLLARGHPVGVRRAAAVVGLSAACSAASPVAGVFSLIAGSALIITGHWRGGVLLVGGATGPLVLAATVFSDGGMSPFSAEQAMIFTVLAVAVAVLVPARYPAVRVGAVLTAAAVLAGHVIATPLGGNTARLPLLFAAPVVAATAELPLWALAVAVTALVWWQPPLVGSDVTGAGAHSTRPGFFAPLAEQLERRQPVGRLEIVPLRDHWEAAYVAETVVPLARGWERQADVGRNRVFYGGALTPATYEHWLRENAVALVALPRSEPLDPAGVRERRLIGGRLPYLRLSWSSSDWQLYAVRDAEPLAAGGARLISSDAAGVTFDTDRPGRVLVRLRFSRWMTLSGPVGACIGRQHGWTSVSVAQAGRYRISSAWQLRPDRRC